MKWLVIVLAVALSVLSIFAGRETASREYWEELALALLAERARVQDTETVISRLSGGSLDAATRRGYAELMVRAGSEARVDPRLIAAVVYIESRYKPNAVSKKGAIGLMQVMPFWHEHLPFVEKPRDLFRPDVNIRAGAFVLAHYTRECGPDLLEVLRCYEAGPRGPDTGYGRLVLAALKRGS